MISLPIFLYQEGRQVQAQAVYRAHTSALLILVLDGEELRLSRKHGKRVYGGTLSGTWQLDLWDPAVKPFLEALPEVPSGWSARDKARRQQMCDKFAREYAEGGIRKDDKGQS